MREGGTFFFEERIGRWGKLEGGRNFGEEYFPLIDMFYRYIGSMGVIPPKISVTLAIFGGQSEFFRLFACDTLIIILLSLSFLNRVGRWGGNSLKFR